MIMPRMTNEEFAKELKPGQLVRVRSVPGWGRRQLYFPDSGTFVECEKTEDGELLTFLYGEAKSAFRNTLSLYFLNKAGMVVCVLDVFKQTNDLVHQLQPVE
jgi:hypothetical protein